MALSPDEVRELLDRYSWKPGERAARLAALDERREAGDDADEWRAPEPTREPVIYKSRPVKPRDTGMPNSSQLWEAWLDRRIERGLKAIEGGLADVLAEERARTDKIIAELRRENEALDALVEALTARLDELERRTSPGTKTAPTPLAMVG
jgi:hypothetical protein